MGGKLSDNKGINKKGGGLTAPALTEKDKKDIKIAAKLKADYVAVSFPRDKSDVEYTRMLLRKSGSCAHVVSKIERVEAVRNIEEIVDASDVVMVARGDLAVEVGEENVPTIQKKVIQCARRQDKAVITATQMMESMILSPTPTRAEVSDVANAVLDGTDAVMLSAESASGRYPVEAVTAMSRVCFATERSAIAADIISRDAANNDEKNHYGRCVDKVVVVSAVYLANRVDARAIVVLTESGSTALWMSRIGTAVPIYALSPSELTLGLMTLYRGVVPIKFDSVSTIHVDVNKAVSLKLEENGAVKAGDLIIVTSGDYSGISGGTNKIQVLQVGR